MQKDTREDRHYINLGGSDPEDMEDYEDEFDEFYDEFDATEDEQESEEERREARRERRKAETKFFLFLFVSGLVLIGSITLLAKLIIRPFKRTT